MAKQTESIVTTDSEGRLCLGEAWADRTFIVEAGEHEVVLQLARVIREREGWLYDNPEALASVTRGLKQARRGQLTAGPNLRKAAAVARKLKDQ